MQALFYRVSGFMSGSRLIFSLGSSDLGSQTLQIIICRWNFGIDTVHDFLIKLGIKPCLHILKISIFSLNHVIVRPTKIMNNLLKVCKIYTFKVIFWHLKSTESY